MAGPRGSVNSPRNHPGSATEDNQIERFGQPRCDAASGAVASLEREHHVHPRRDADHAGGQFRLGLSLGRRTARLVEFLSGADALFLESNYDPAMQRASGRSPYLVDRIMGGDGHLSNEQALEIALAVDRVQPLGTLQLLHLSRQCNCPRLVARLWQERAPALVPRLTVTAQHAPSAAVEPLPRLHHATLFGGYP